MKIRRFAWLVLLTALALTLRIRWNIWEHPAEKFRFVDMEGYIARAEHLLDRRAEPYDTLFPYGTHVLLFLMRAVSFGHGPTATAIGYAILGAAVVVFTVLIVEKLRGPGLPALLSGAAVAVYFPLISLGGYYLTEIPFAALITAAVYLSLRVDEQPTRANLLALGGVLALGTAVRPQILLYAAGLLAYLLLVRRTRASIGLRGAAQVIMPIALILAFSSVRLFALTGQVGLVSSNGPMNRIFGRCHNLTLEAQLPNFGLNFSPTPLGALRTYERAHPGPLRLDPVEGDKIVVNAHLWEAAPLNEVADACVKKSGLLRQARFAVTHAVMLWYTNELWPTSWGREWAPRIIWWDWFHNVYILPAALLALTRSMTKAGRRRVLLLIPLVALVVTAMLYFGDARFRTPYDGILIGLAVDGYASVLDVVSQRLLKRSPASLWARLGALLAPSGAWPWPRLSRLAALEARWGAAKGPKAGEAARLGSPGVSLEGERGERFENSNAA